MPLYKTKDFNKGHEQGSSKADHALPLCEISFRDFKATLQVFQTQNPLPPYGGFWG